MHQHWTVLVNISFHFLWFFSLFYLSFIPSSALVYILCLTLSWGNGSHQMNTGSSLLLHICVLTWVCQSSPLPLPKWKDCLSLFLNPGMSPWSPPPPPPSPTHHVFRFVLNSHFVSDFSTTYLCFCSISEPQFQDQVVQAETWKLPMMAARSPLSPVCRSQNVTSAAILPAQAASISCLVCTTASELCPHFYSCSLDFPLHSTAVKWVSHLIPPYTHWLLFL